MRVMMVMTDTYKKNDNPQITESRDRRVGARAKAMGTGFIAKVKNVLCRVDKRLLGNVQEEENQKLPRGSIQGMAVRNVYGF